MKERVSDPPMGSQLGFRHSPFAAPNLIGKETVHVKSLFVFKHKVDGPAQLVGQDAQGLAFVIFSFQPRHVVFGRLTVAQH